MSQETKPGEHPILSEMTSADLIRLLADYVKAPVSITEADAAFIKAIQSELKKRRDI